MSLVLIRRETCGLCELAVGILETIGQHGVEQRYLEDDPALETQYGWRIPVLRDTASGRELDWPFDGVKVSAFLHAN